MQYSSGRAAYRDDLCAPCGSLPGYHNFPDIKPAAGVRQFTMKEPSETHLRVMRLLHDQPDITQRELAVALGVSLGRVNYCLKALVQRGWVKMGNFGKSKNKLRYAYVLTPKGATAKTRLTAAFLKRKLVEFEALKQEIDRLEREVASE
jgi:EPS-associated MarR family transcriptional regulator